MDGAKAYILPAVAALLLLAYFLFRPDPDSFGSTGDSAPATEGDSMQARVDAALRGAEVPAALSPEYTATVGAALEPLVTTCRTKLNVEGEVKVQGSVAAAASVGGYFKTLELQSAVETGHEGFHLCIREAVADLELPPPPSHQAGAFGRQL